MAERLRFGEYIGDAKWMERSKVVGGRGLMKKETRG